MKEKVSLKDKIKNFFSDEKKRLYFIIICISLVIVLSITLALLLSGKSNKESNTSTTTRTTTTTTISVDKLFRGYNVSELGENKSYQLDIPSRYEIIYSDNSQDYIHLCVDDVDYTYEINLKNGVLEFKELVYDKEHSGEVYTGEKFEYKLSSKIKNFIVGHNCYEVEYDIVVLDEANNIYTYSNTIESKNNISELISSFKKFKTISTPKKIGLYNSNNVPHLECPNSMMVYLDKSNNLRKLDSKNTLFYSDAYYRYIGDEETENIFVMNDKKMRYLNDEAYLSDGEELLYRGSFYDSKYTYIIDSNNYLYKISNSDTPSTKIKKLNTTKIKRIGSKELNQTNYKKLKYDVLIQFEDDLTLELNDVFDYEMLV